MAERNGSHRTARGIELEKQHDARYKKWLIGKSNSRGKIIDAQYIGNSVYGIVKVFFEDGTDNLYSNRNAFRPRKTDFNLID
jgi:hypothetical protein